MENIKQMTQNYVLMMMLRWQRSPSIVYWVALPWPAPVSAHWRWPGEREGHCVCFNPWSELNMETMCLFYICFYSDMIFFCLTQKEWAPTWRSSNWSSFLFLQFWAATLDMDLLIFLLCFTIFSGIFHPVFIKLISFYHLVFAATTDVSYLVLLLFCELAFAQEVLLSIIIVTIIIVITITHIKSQPETHPCQFEPPSAGRGKRVPNLRPAYHP